jgi:hypothetical protein
MAVRRIVFCSTTLASFILRLSLRRLPVLVDNVPPSFRVLSERSQNPSAEEKRILNGFVIQELGYWDEIKLGDRFFTKREYPEWSLWEGAELILSAIDTSKPLTLSTIKNPLKDFLRLHWPVVLGTDDPSVWDVSELQNEFKLAIEAGLIETKTRLDAMVRNSIKRSFVEDKTKARSLNDVKAGLALQ